MGDKELGKKAREDLLYTLEHFASREKQIKYKEAVPFVHIPIELMQQWENFARLLREERKWFLDVVTPEEREAMGHFDRALNTYDEPGVPSNVEDVPKVFEDEGWLALCKEAEKLLALLRRQPT